MCTQLLKRWLQLNLNEYKCTGLVLYVCRRYVCRHVFFSAYILVTVCIWVCFLYLFGHMYITSSFSIFSVDRRDSSCWHLWISSTCTGGWAHICPTWWRKREERVWETQNERELKQNHIIQQWSYN